VAERFSEGGRPPDGVVVEVFPETEGNPGLADTPDVELLLVVGDFRL
jgi:hypothetical protein